MNRINIGIVGIGAMGKKYAKMLYDNEIDGISLTAVVCRSDKNKNWAEKNIMDTKVYNTAEEMYESGICNAVIIATPHKTHPELTVAALKKGLYVMCDKPSGITVSDAEYMEGFGKYAVMFHNRTYPVIKKLKELLDNNTIGKINRILLENTDSYRTRHYHNSSDWRSSWKGEGGGMLINQGQHIIDYFLWLFGMPKSIYANIKYGKYNDFKVDDEATLVMDYGDCSSIFIMSTGEIHPRNHISITGDMGKIIVDNNVITIIKNSISTDEYGRISNINTRDNINFTEEKIICENPERPYHIMLENFRSHILNKTELTASGTDGKNALIITNGAYLSSWLGKTINIPFDNDEYNEMLNKVIENE